jgi:hypothetical protein
MSGDGKRGVGHRPQATAPILDSTSAHVVGGAGAFMIVANGHEGFSDAIRQKLTIEIAGRVPEFRLAAASQTAASPAPPLE